MAYTAPTAAQIKALYPAFAAVPDVTVEAYIVRANRMVDTTWTEGDYTTAIMLLACHLMTVDGLGTSNDAKMGGFSMIRSGQLTLQRASGADGGVPDAYSGSSFGRQFYALLRLNKPGGAVANSNAALPLAYPWPYY